MFGGVIVCGRNGRGRLPMLRNLEESSQHCVFDLLLLVWAVVLLLCEISRVIIAPRGRRGIPYTDAHTALTPVIILQRKYM